MPDNRFHTRMGPFSLADIAKASETVLGPNAHPDMIIHDVAALDRATRSDLSFLDNPRYKAQLATTQAGVCIVSQDNASVAPQNLPLLLSKAPYRSYALAATLFYPPVRPVGIDPRAIVHPTAVLGADVVIEAGAYIGAGVTLGDGCWIGANAIITHAILDSGVRVHAGAAIGQEGFGFAINAQGVVPVPQLGRVMIGKGCNIGANTTIDRGAGPDTVIGDGTVIDNLVQIAHNVVIGKGCVIAAQTGISGSTHIGDYSVIGGQVGIAGHLVIGRGVRIAAQSGVTKNIPDGQEWVGFPAEPRLAFWKTQARIKKLLSKAGFE